MIIGVINQLSYPGGRTLSVVVANKKPGLLGDSHIYIYIYIYDDMDDMERIKSN